MLIKFGQNTALNPDKIESMHKAPSKYEQGKFGVLITMDSGDEIFYEDETIDSMLDHISNKNVEQGYVHAPYIPVPGATDCPSSRGV